MRPPHGSRNPIEQLALYNKGAKETIGRFRWSSKGASDKGIKVIEYFERRCFLVSG